MADFTINDKDLEAVDSGQHILHQAGATNSGKTARWSIATLLSWLKSPVGGDLVTKSNADADYAPIAHVGTGGAAHLAATVGANGFMSSTDKTKLDGLDATDYAPVAHVGDTGAAHGVVTGSVNGFMISTDKTKLDGLDANDYAPAAHVGATGAAHGNATGSVAGFMSAADKTKLDSITGGADELTYNAAGTIDAGDVCYFTGTQWALAQGNAIGTTEGLLGVAKTSATAGNPLTCVCTGEITTGGGLAAGSLYYISTSVAGGIQTTLPTGAVYTRILGYALSATVLRFRPSDDYILGQ